MKEETKLIKKIDWNSVFMFATFGWIVGFIVAFFMGALLILVSPIPLLNVYVHTKICKNDQEIRDTKVDYFTKEETYRLVNRIKFKEEVWEKVND